MNLYELKQCWAYPTNLVMESFILINAKVYVQYLAHYLYKTDEILKQYDDALHELYPDASPPKDLSIGDLINECLFAYSMDDCTSEAAYHTFRLLILEPFRYYQTIKTSKSEVLK